MRLHINESYYNDWEEVSNQVLYIGDDRLKLPIYGKIFGDNVMINVTPEEENDELVWTIYYSPDFGNAGFKFVQTGFLNSEEAIDYVYNYVLNDLGLNESMAYNLSNDESRRKEVADRFGKAFSPDNHYLVCKDDKILNIQVGKKYKCTACNGQRVEVVSIDDIFNDDRGDSALITAYYRGKMIAISSTQLYESLTEKISNNSDIPDKYKLRTIIGKFFYGTANSYKLAHWRIARGGYDLVAEIYFDNLPVCDIVYTPYGYEVECLTDDFIGIDDFVKDVFKNLNVDIVESIIKERVSDKDYTQSKKGIAYKVFQFKDGKLYPPMVANAGNKDTPVGVWLDAEPGEFVEIDGLQRVVQRGVKGDKLRQRVANLDNLSPEERKAEVKKIKSSTLAYRPGWHLGDEPRAAQFDREASWEILDELPEGVEVSGNVTNEDTLAKKGTPGNIGKYFLIKSTGKYAHIFGGNGQVFFPYNFVWAECEYVMDIDYQDEAMSYGYRNGKKFQHSLAGLPRVPEGGSYKYRTNPRPDTVPWVITGAIKVTKLLDDYDVQQILGSKAPERQGGDKTLSELGLKQI